MFSLDVFIIRIIANLFDGLVISIFIKMIYDKKLRILPTASYSLIYALFSTIGGLFFIDISSIIVGSTINIIFYLILALSARILYKLDLKRCFVSVGVCAIFYLLASSLSTLILAEFSVPLEKFTVNPNFFLFGVLILDMFEVLFLLISRLFKPILVFPKEIKIKTYIFFIANIAATLVILELISALYMKVLSNITFEKNIMEIVTILIVIYFTLSMTYMVYFSKQELRNQELEYQKFYNNTLSDLIADLRRFRHNYNNEMASISWFAQTKDFDGLTKYISELQDSWNRIDAQSVSILFRIKNAAITGLLLSKIQKAHNLDIQIRVNIPDEVSMVNMKISRLCEALGILMDNAIEASVESKERVLKMDITNSNGKLSFSIENSIKEKPDLIKMFDKGWSTKGNNRGLGLWILDEIKRQNKNIILNTFVDDKSVKQEFIVT